MIHPITRLSLLGCLCAGLASGAWAQTQATAPSQVCGPRLAVTLSASATEEITQDLLVVTLQAEKEGAVAAEVQAGLKQLMEGALQEARKAQQPPGLSVRTGSYAVQPVWADGHATGIYAWDYLRSVADAA